MNVCCESPDIIREDWYKVCLNCAVMIEPPFFDRPVIMVRQTKSRNTVSKYSRVNNFELHLKQLKGDIKIPDETLEKIISIKKALIGKEINYKSIRSYMKTQKLSKLYPYIPTLMKKFWGISILNFSEGEEERMILRFLEFERAFETMEKGERKNSIGYEFLIRQFLEESGNESFRSIPTLSDKKKLEEVRELYNQVVMTVSL